MTRYFRPLAQTDRSRPAGALSLAGGWAWFTHVEEMARGGQRQIRPACDLPSDWHDALTAPRAAIAGLTAERPRIMGILNTTPDSFSDGGQHQEVAQAVAAALAMEKAGADLIDVGGESTRPGADTVTPKGEIGRTAPVIAAARAAGLRCPISIDTRKAEVAVAAHAAGAGLVNDVSGFTFDPALALYCAQQTLPVCVMHAQGDPKTMQLAPRYDDVVLDVYDFLANRLADLVAQGVPRERIIVDPGIGFGKTQEHNLTLLRGLSLFHGLGVPILLGASRKRFIGTIGGAERADARMPGSVSVALAALDQGVQYIRVHDVAETAQAVALWAVLKMNGTNNG